MRKELTLWISALTLAAMAFAGAAVLNGQVVVTQDSQRITTGGGALQVNSDRPMEIGNGIIFGHAVEAGSTRPVSGAIVTLSLSGSAPLRVMADGQGQFAFRDLPPGRFTLSSSKAGYVDGASGRLRPNGPTQSLELTADQHVSDVTIPMWKHGAIAGRVMDEGGEPLVGVSVRALKRTIVAGKRQLTSSATDTTDDRGMYRISSLEPGEYVVVVPMSAGGGLASVLASLGLPGRDMPLPAGGGGGGVMAFAARVDTGGGPIAISLDGDGGVAPAGLSPDGHTLTYQTEFYPASTTSARATNVSIASGDERVGIDFQLKPVRTVNITGVVSSPDGNNGDLNLTMIPAESEDLVTPIETASTTSDASGSFRFANVPPGQYVIRAVRSPRGAQSGQTTTVTTGGDTMRMVMTRVVAGGPQPPLPTEPTYWAEMNVGVGQNDVNDLSVPLRTGLRVSGRVEFNGSAERPTPEQLSSISISLEPADGRTNGVSGSVRGRIESTGQFTTMGVPVGKYVLRVGAPSKWTLQGASFNGTDVVDSPIDLHDGDASGVVITFVDRQSDVSGTVLAANGSPDATATVLAFPTDRSMWSGAGSAPRRLKNARAGKDGSYQLGNLPPGEYFVVAIPEGAAGEWQNPDFLDTVSRTATRLRIEVGDKKTQSLTTARLR